MKDINIQKISDLINTIYIKRDDLIPFSFGGNKVRIAQEFISDMKKKGCNCIIGYGNARSNLSRALSNLCAKEKIECHLISPADDDGEVVRTYNEKLCRVCNAIIHQCLKTNVSEKVEEVIELCKSKGLKPYYINGDKYGKGNEEVPVRAYFNAYSEISDFEKNEGFVFDYIFLPTGTGMTHSGLLCGINKYKSKTNVIGISIARNSENEKKVIKKFVDCFCLKNGLENISEEKIMVDDSYLCGGYGKASQEVKEFIHYFFKNYGIPLDANYTGKAYFGMLDYLQKNNIKNKKVLFLHTGGTPLFFDLFKNDKILFDVKEESDFESLKRFLSSVDNELPVTLSSRIDFDEYLSKVISKGHVLSVRMGNKIIAAALFYSNDKINNIAYLSLFGILDEYRGQGLGPVLIKGVCDYCKKSEMSKLALETDISNTSAISFYSREGFIIESMDSKIHMIKEF